jgi:hypothetical protein
VTHWTPEAELDRLVATALVQRREAMAEHIELEGQKLDNDLASRGLIRSGAYIGGHYELEANAFDECAQGMIDDVLQLFRDIYGEVPVDAAAWIRQKVMEWIDGLANGIAKADAERRKSAGVGGTSELPRGLTKARRRLDVQLGKPELKARLRELTPPVCSQNCVVF